MASKLRLGKGLDALLPPGESSPLFPEGQAPGDGAPEEPGTRVVSLALDKLQANPDQPRKYFDEDKLRELADSIREHGIIDPLLVEAGDGGMYTIIGGERRFRAAALAGLTEVPALVRVFSEETRMEVALIENIQRADLNPVEEALAYRKLMELTGLSQDEVAGRVGKNRSTVANTLRLLKLPPVMREALERAALSPGHGRALLSVNGPEDQEILFREILDQGLSVREAEKRAGALNSPPGPAEAEGGEAPGTGPEAEPAPEVPVEGGLPPDSPGEGERRGAGESRAAKRDPELAAIEQRFIETLGTKVSIQGDLRRGKIWIDYYSMEDLERVLEILNRSS